MAKGLLFLMVCLLASYEISKGQPEKPLVKPVEVFKLAQTYQDSGWYEKADEILRSIDPGDTSYDLAQTELAANFMAAKKYKEAVELSINLLQHKSQYTVRQYLIAGNSYDEWGYPDTAIDLYKRALHRYPNHYLFYYNLGVTYSNLKQYNLAIESLEHAILLNPFHGSSHLLLGRIMALMGQYAHAMMSMEVFLIIEPNSNRSNRNLVFLNDFVNNNLSSSYQRISPDIDNSAFEEPDKLLSAGIAMNAGYQPKLKFSAPVMKQSLLFFETLQYKSNSGDFWMEHYVPFFLTIKQKGYVEDFLYESFSSASSPEVAKEYKAREKEIAVMNKLLSTELDKLHLKCPVFLNGKDTVADVLLNSNNAIGSIGNYTDKKRSGNWEFYYSNGEKKFEGVFNENGQQEGLWKKYDNKGNLLKTDHYVHGQLSGEEVMYYENGQVKFKGNYVNDMGEGEFTYFMDCNVVSAKIMFHQDKRNGKAVFYTNNGTIYKECQYVNDELDGDFKTYYTDGQLQSAMHYENGKLQGEYKEYYRNGKISEIAHYMHAKLDGTYQTYYPNGKTKEECAYKNGMQIGFDREYNYQGKLKSVSEYDDHGLETGFSKDFDKDGKVYCIREMHKDKLVSKTYLDKQGKVIIHNALGKGLFDAKGYYPDGKLNWTGTYLDSMRNGEWTFYYKNGKIENILHYLHGKLNGKYTYLDEMGHVKLICNYSEGDLNGYYRNYFKNGQIQCEGWYVSGSKEGNWYYYHSDGTYDWTCFFQKDVMSGIEKDYGEKGVIKYMFTHYNGKIQSLIAYDSIGNEIKNEVFENGQDYILPDFHGNERTHCSFLCNSWEGKMTFKWIDGKILEEIQYVNGKKDGPYRYYNLDGSVAVEGTYADDEKTGVWKFYDEKGQISQIVPYTNNELDSINTGFYPNGAKEFTKKFENGEPRDTSFYYDPGGMLMFGLVYDNYGLIGYLDPGKSRDTIQMIDPGDTGTILTHYANGRISSIQPYSNGHLSGKQVIFFLNGNKSMDYQFDKDGLQGPLIFYNEDGSICFCRNYLDGSLNGECRFYYPNGKLEHTEYYLYGELTGTWSYFDEKGNVIQKHHFWSGILTD